MSTFLIKFNANSIKMLKKSYFGLLSITNAAITPGTQPQIVNKRTIKTEPQPLSKIDNGGKKIANKTLQILIICNVQIN